MPTVFLFNPQKGPHEVGEPACPACTAEGFPRTCTLTDCEGGLMHAHPLEERHGKLILHSRCDRCGRNLLGSWP